MRRLSTRRDQGSTLVLALVMCVTIGTVLASCLGLIGSRYKVTVRSQCWNQAMPVLEAGLEEAIAHLHTDRANLELNGWTREDLAGLPVYRKERTLADGSKYLVNIYEAASDNPYIYSTGFVPAPLEPGNYISRTVRIRGVYPPLINIGMGAVKGIQMNGTGLATDSYNSGDPALSTNGGYDPSKTSTNGDVASVYGPVNFGNHTIAGDLFLGPEAAGSVVTPSQTGGGIYTDFNISFPDVVLPNLNWLPAPTTTDKKGTIHNFTTSGDYYVADSGDIIVDPGVTVTLRVDTTTFNPANIHILNTNSESGSLIIYQVAGTCTMNGNVTVESGRPRHFYYYGLPEVTSVTYGGTSSFIGVVYAPGADLKLDGGGNNVNVCGATVSKSVVLNGHYNFHFDEDLLTSSPRPYFVATSWQEL